MKEIGKPDIETLIKLQEAETEIVRIQSVLEKVEKQKEELEKKLRQFEKALNKYQKELLQSQTICKDQEREIKVVDDRIIKSNENLRMVKTNKEYQVLLREVDDNKKRKDALETELLENLDENDKITEIVEERSKEYKLLKAQISEEQGNIDSKATDDRELLQEYQERQEKIGRNLDAGLISRFSKISKMTKGLAVVRVKNEVCMGCFMNIPPQLYIEVQKFNDLVLCPQCSRIL
ncbi:MAG: nucleotide-binding protein, partial [Desulfobacteraceae bacterium]|nr:nucleotide-binding protein [Desulfobacteraceae bacterium]